MPQVNNIKIQVKKQNILPLSQFKIETTADSAISLNTWRKSNSATKNNRSDTLITLCRLSSIGCLYLQGIRDRDPLKEKETNLLSHSCL